MVIWKNKRPKGQDHISCTWAQCATFLTDWPRQQSYFSNRFEKHKCRRGLWDLASCKVFVEFCSAVSEKSKMYQPIRWPSSFSDRPENTNLVVDVEILLPLKFHWFPFRGFRGEVKNVTANQKPGRSSWVFDLHEKKTNAGEFLEILLPVKLRWILFSGFRGEVENVSANQRPGQSSLFLMARKTHNW